MPRKLQGQIDIVGYNASSGRTQGSVIDIDPDLVKRDIAVSAFAGFLVTQQTARRMLTRGGGSMLLTGATASHMGFANSAQFAMGKFALRGLAESAARELGSKGIHVAHFIIGRLVRSDWYFDPTFNRDNTLDPDATAATYLHVPRQ